jgi:acetyl-CoA carboxylase biotin carboxylase subunit
MAEAGVPVVPGSNGVVANVTEALESASRIGYPVIVKASAGGGGKGMRVAMNAAELPSAFVTASAEAAKGFGNNQVYLERYLVNPRHVEVQFVADAAGNVITLGERDCSMQRHHQKVVEESPCPVLTAEVRKQMCAAAVRAAKSVRYVGVGTVEFLYEPEAGCFYFMEINTRLQVEHAVTEMICGIDLVATQIAVALGERLPWKSAPKAKGHAVEIRINAEDPRRGFAPCPGKVEFCQMPGGPGVRVDSHLYSGYVVPPYYDSMIAKLIVHGDTREIMYRRAMSALNEIRISGITTNVDFARDVLESSEFFSGEYNTGTLPGLLGQSE